MALEESKNGTLGQLSNIVDPQHQFGSLLIKPVQRICKYPLLLKQLLRYTDKATNPQAYAELEAGITSIERVTSRVNETKREQDNIAIKKDLEARVITWKELNPSKLGNLLLYEHFETTMAGKDRPFKCYLFRKLMICCREEALDKNGKKQTKTMSMSKKNKTAKMTRESGVATGINIKGRMHIRDILDVYVPDDRSNGINRFE